MPQPRGWFEGTLDVISGISTTSRASTPTRPQRISVSAPSSPILRLPSQDSMDRSMHNENLHGKSSAQQIKDLKAANARLTAQTAAMEADFMNQLNKATQQHESQMMQLQQKAQQKETTLQLLEQRYASLEARSKEKDEALVRLREESAFYRHTISELKASQSSSNFNDSTASLHTGEIDSTEKRDLLKRIAELEQELETVKTTITEDGVKIDPIQQLQQALDNAQNDWKKQDELLQSKIKALHELKGDESVQIQARDDLLQKLCQQVLSQDQQWTTLSTQLAKLQAQVKEQNQYHQDEVEDLRTLNDAQEEELSELRAQLEEALKEIEWRTAAMDDRSREIEEVQVVDEVSRSVELQTQLEEARITTTKLQEEYDNTCLDNVKTVNELKDQIKQLISSGQRDKATPDNEQEMLILTSSVKEMEMLYINLEKELKETKDNLTAVRREKTHMVQSHQREIAKLKLEKSQQKDDYEKRIKALESLKNESSVSSTGEATSDSNRITSLNNEIEALKKEIQLLEGAEYSQQSGGSVEEDLRKELNRLQESEKQLLSKLESLTKLQSSEFAELKEKLADRDTTISSLVKSSATLEAQLSSCRSEIEALRNKLAKNSRGQSAERLLSNTGQSNEEIAILRVKVEKLQGVEESLSKEVFRLKRQLRSAKQDCTRLRSQLNGDPIDVSRGFPDDDSSAGGSVTASTSSSQKYIQERDDAIAKLVKQTMSQERTIAKLTERLRRAGEMKSSPSKDQTNYLLQEMEQLRKETEMFAGQVIEQDEEIESLTKILNERELKIADLETEVRVLSNKLNSSSSQNGAIRALEAEIDELKEAREVLQDEVRLLRRKVREVDIAQERLQETKTKLTGSEKELEETKKLFDEAVEKQNNLQAELSALKLQQSASVEYEQTIAQNQRRLDELKDQIMTLKEELREKEDKIQQFEAEAEATRTNRRGNHNLDDLEVEELINERDMLKKNLANQAMAIDDAKDTIRELERMLAEKSSADASALEEEKEEFIAEIESLQQELQDCRDQLKDLETQKVIIDDFKEKLERADEAREESEKHIVDTYERKLSLLKLDKDVFIDKLRKELTDEKESKAEKLTEMSNKIKQYEDQIQNMRRQMSVELHQRENRIFTLEHTLAAQEQLVNNMKTEMDHLQGSMVNTTNGRREELENMQQEIVEITATAAKQEREITSLRMQIEDKDLIHKAQVAKLYETINTLERQSNDSHRTAADLQTELRMQEVKDRLEKLKWHNSVLQEENEALRERLIEISENDSVSDLRQKHEEQKEIIQNLQNQLLAAQEDSIRLKKLEKELAEAKASMLTPFPLPKAPVVPKLASESEPSPEEVPSPKKTSRKPTPSPDRVNKAKKGHDTPQRKGLLERFGIGGHHETKETASVLN